MDEPEKDKPHSADKSFGWISIIIAPLSLVAFGLLAPVIGINSTFFGPILGIVFGAIGWKTVVGKVGIGLNLVVLILIAVIWSQLPIELRGEPPIM
jgi:hypothetical protein